MPFVDPPVLLYSGLGQYMTVGPTVYVGNPASGGDVVTIPGGFETDLATVPRLFWALLPPHGAYERAAVLHDWFCRRLAAGDSPVSARDADGIFRRVMREARVGFTVRWLMWWGVRVGALANPARRPGWWRDLPAFTAITVLVSAAAAVTAWGLDRIVHTLVDLAL